MTIRQLVAYGQQQLLPHSDSAKLDTELLICFVMNKSRSYLLTWPEQQLSAAEYQHLARLLQRRRQGEPIAYLVQQAEFWSLPLQVSNATLIPRPDTELLVELVLAHHQGNSISCLDLGTGTGAIALALASEQPDWQITAIDYSHDAVKLAQDNASRLAMTRVSIYQSHWFEQVPTTARFDVIVSNPPYIDENDHHLELGDVRYEPKSALVAADNGLADIKAIASQARSYLNCGGYLYLEHGYQQGSSVQQILADLGFSHIETKRDYNDNERVTFACFYINPK
ncbi:[protein release factor]-glutamine N5-methyltransferase [Colwellia chukchiensis]|uniref:Release factor glutamine methyltransferase n=2 Tax=Colwellia chukchiensis TaxID=641665 RepID=A0A1H7GC31_9GAMM|nr:peptide chain release factor N(5)-glutamine methyltransferase [Colwellia chukchiensis]SEK35813.1 [protein release factor]-glutamine N5-methyltransferase [Colwellia chukchiensis]